MEIDVNIKLLDERARIPEYKTDGAAAFDICSLTTGTVEAGHPLTCRTGIAVEIPAGFAMLIKSRSGHGFNDGVRLANSVGVIDSDYRGEIKVKLTADERKSLRVNVGDRIAQAYIVPIPRTRFRITDALSDTARGTGGFGSTGA